MAIVKISDLPLVDSPVEGTDLFVVVQDNVTKKAYASDIQTYVGFEEVQTATAGQTVFNLTTMTYAAGANNLMVFVDGVNQYEGSSYVETDNNTVTFTQGLHQGALVKFSTVQTQTSSVANAGAVTFLQAGTGAVPRSVQSKERDIVSVKDFGAVGDGVTDDTVAIQAALNYAATSYAAVYLPRGDYKTTATLTFYSASTLFGEGLDQSVIRYYGTGGTALALEGTVPSPKVKINLYDFGLYNQATGVNGVNMASCLYSNLARLRIYGFVVGVAISKCWNNEYDFIYCDANSQDGFNLSTTDANALNFVSCQGVGNGRAGFYSEGGRAVLMSNCTWEANGEYGVWISGQNAFRPLSYTIHGCYIEGNGLFEVYLDSQGSGIPAGVTIRDTYFEFIAAKAATAIRIVDGYNVIIDGCTFDNQGGSYTNSLYMASAGTKDRIRWGRNFDSSTNGVYSEIFYENQTKAEPIAWGRFTVSGGAIASSNSYGVANIEYISTGVYEITLLKDPGVTNYCVVASAENGASTNMFLCSPAPPTSSTVFRIATGTAVSTLADARTVNFTVSV